MSSFRRFALLLALGLVVATAAQAQSSSQANDSSSNLVAFAAQDQAPQAAAPTNGQTSVQARIRARRAQRRTAAIHDTYSHHYDAYFGLGYQRFEPGPGYPGGPMLQHTHNAAWNVGATRYYSDRLGISAEGRGYYSTAYVGNVLNPSKNQLTNVKISQYYALAGPSYRFYVQPKLSVAGRVLGGMAYGKFSDNLGSYKSSPQLFGLWPDGYTFAFSAGIPVEYSVTPNLAVRLAPEYFFSGFGSTIQHSRGVTTGIVYRFGKQ